jgi:hypothetical protein
MRSTDLMIGCSCTVSHIILEHSNARKYVRSVSGLMLISAFYLPKVTNVVTFYSSANPMRNVSYVSELHLFHSVHNISHHITRPTKAHLTYVLLLVVLCELKHPVHT